MNERKGASRRSDIPAHVLQGLNDGTLETATLAEGLSVDFRELLRNAAPEFGTEDIDQIVPTDGVKKRMESAGRLLAERCGPGSYERFAGHPADTVRGWSAFLVAALPELSIKERLHKIQLLADDSHFGVREWAWLAMRSHLAASIDESLRILLQWAQAASPNLRRFAVEITRPRGVWCSHLPLLKENPAVGLPVLEIVRSDSSRYVQDSVGNWLNDAGKSQPDWVVDVCTRWRVDSPTPETEYICRRALRNLPTNQS